MDNCRFSIIIPVYNRNELVKRAVNSLLMQKYQSFEIILVDDGSTDNSGEVCDEFAQNNDNVKVIHTVNQGLASARNTGIKNATGEYLLFCDDDDYFVRDALQKLSEAIESYGMVDIFVFGFLVGGDYPLYPSGYPFGEILGNERIHHEILPAEIGFEDRKGRDLMPFAWNKAFRRKTVESLNAKFIEGLRVWEDKIFWILLIGDISSVVVLEEALYHYTSDASERLTEKWNSQILEKMPLKYSLMKQKYGNEFDFEKLNDGYANLIVTQIIDYYRAPQKKSGDLLENVLTDRDIKRWLSLGRCYKDPYSKKIAEYAQKGDFQEMKKAVDQFLRYEKNCKRRQTVKKWFKKWTAIYIHRIKKLFRIITGREYLYKRDV